MLTGILWAAFDPVETCGAGGLKGSLLPSQNNPMWEYCVLLLCRLHLRTWSVLPQEKLQQKNKTIREEIQNDSPCSLPPDMSFYTSCNFPPSPRCSLTLSQNLTFPSNYRCFSLLAVGIEAIFSWHQHMFKDKASFNYFVTFMWGLCGYACEEEEGELCTWTYVCSVNDAHVSQPQELFS